jgi:hypothetical protein
MCNDTASLHLFTDGSFRTCAASSWTVRDSSDPEISLVSVSLIPLYMEFHWEVVVIENESVHYCDTYNRSTTSEFIIIQQ